MSKKRIIRKVAVLGSGVMGSRIACHFANAGMEVMLLDIVPFELDDKEKAQGLTMEDPKVRNRIVNDSLTTAVKSNPSPLYRKSYASRIRTGNFDDDLHLISECDWVVEAIIERADIKQGLFEKVEKHRKKGSLITTNTSGIPISILTKGRSEDFVKNFFGTHFFNPPRYLPLLEIIPGQDTSQEAIDFMMDFGGRILGKKTVLCKDTPAFIANRIGVYSIMNLFHYVDKHDLTSEEIDMLTGPIMGRPKSATFRTCDVVGLDTLVHVANGLKDNCPNDEAHELFELPSYLQKMLDKNLLGSKTKAGFYKKVKDENGKSQILTLDLESLEYRVKEKPNLPEMAQVKPIEDLKTRLKALYQLPGKSGDFYRAMFHGLFEYVANRIPEISDDIYRVDDAMRAGFGWEQGPFELWDILGVEKVADNMKKEGLTLARWVGEFINSGNNSFYKAEQGRLLCYEPSSAQHVQIPGTEEVLSLDALEDNVVWGNKDCTITDIGDGIINLEFHTKMNTIGAGVIQGLNKAVDLAEQEYDGLTIYNRGQNFSAGANVGMIFMFAVEQEWEELDMAIRQFQNAMMRLRYSSIPVVAAPHNMTLGGGCEMCMHADKVIAHAELYMGLVEFGVGLIPGGGGTKEFVKRLSNELKDGDIRINRLRNRFLTIGQAKVSTSAKEAFDLGYLRKGVDEVVMSRELQLALAKEACLELVDAGYTQPVEDKDITVMGQEGLGIVYVGANSMKSGNYISEHDQLISEKLGYVMCGGDLSSPTQVSEKYLLDMERKAFLELCTKRKTLERIESILKYGKILRN